MTITLFLKQFLLQTTASALVLFGLLTIGEWLVPGSVLPFFDLVDAVLPLIVLLMTSIVVFAKK